MFVCVCVTICNLVTFSVHFFILPNKVAGFELSLQRELFLNAVF